MAAISDLGQDLLGFELQVDVDDLVDQMQDAIQDPAWRWSAGKCATKHAQGHLTWRAVVGEMLRNLSRNDQEWGP